MEEEIDIYADLPNFDLAENNDLDNINKKLSEKCSMLEKQVDDLTKNLESMRKINKNLEVNISSLLKTAKAEIARKDRMIATITSELDNIQFRRGKYGRSAKSTRLGPPSKVTEIRVEEETRFVIPEINETTEPSVEKKVPGEGHRLDGIVNTVFGERLRKRILDSQEEERKLREKETKLKNEEGLIKTEKEILEVGDKVNGEIGTRDRATNDRKRCSEDPTDRNDEKKLRYNESKSNVVKRREEKPRNGSEKCKSDDKYCEEIADDERRIVVAVDNDETWLGGKSVNVTGDNESEERHGRVAMRLMLLSEGKDPGINNDGIKIVEDKRRERYKNYKKSRSRSKSRNRDSKMKRYDHRSQSTTPDEYYKNGRGGKQRDNRRRDSRDRFDRRSRDFNNKDGDNLSEFSREIFDIKERFEHRIGDRARRSGSYNRHKRKDEKFDRNGRSRTPDSNRNVSKEKIAEKFRDDKRSMRNEGTKESKEETKSLVSLEDGEIVDSVTSSPQKLINSNENFIANDTNLKNKSDSFDPVIVELKDTEDMGSSPLSREIWKNRDNEIPVEEKLATNIVESDKSLLKNDFLNSSKDERIENIAQFIANFSRDKKTRDLFIDDKKLDNLKEYCDVKEEKDEEMVSSTIECESETPATDSVVLLSGVKNSETITCANNVNDKDVNEDWHLIAIDSPVKNFEENRHNRIMAINCKFINNLEPLNIPSEVDSSTKSLAEIDSEGSNIDTPELPLIPRENNPSTKKKVVVRALKSIYRKGKKKMILSDTNSENFSKIISINKLSKINSKVAIENEIETFKNCIKDIDDKFIESQSIEDINEISEINENHLNISEDDIKKEDKDNVTRDYDDTKNIDNREKIIEDNKKLNSLDRKENSINNR